MAQPPTTARRCIFCGAPADSREHLFPRWLEKVLPADQPALHYRQIGSDENDRQEWRCLPFRGRARVVCNGCNNGWMSSLEVEAKPLLTGAITRDGFRQRFASASQRLVAAWALKTFLVLQTQGDHLAPAFHGAYLRDHRRPPPQVTIWIGSHYAATFHECAMAYVQRPLTLVSRDGRFENVSDFGYAAWVAIGGVSFFLVGHRYSNRVAIQTHNMMNDLFIKLWGDGTAPIVDWPPECMMDKQLVDVLFSQVEPPTLDIRLSPAAA